MSTSDLRTRPGRTVIIGAGFGGLGMAIALKKAGFDDVLILEKSQDVGGCWRENSYPGAACDVPSHLYSFSFEPNPRWTRKYAPQSEIHAYLQHCARQYGLMDRTRFGAEVASLRFLGVEDGWEVTLSQGEVLHAQFVISACGQLSTPQLPAIEGLSSFKGPQFHSAHWDHGLSLDGLKVAVIGTGASAIQFIPEVAPKVAELTVYQRSAPYVIPKDDRPYTPSETARFTRWPKLQALSRAWIYLTHEARALAFTHVPQAMWFVQQSFLRHLRQQVPDPLLRAQLKPDYTVGCKRVLISNDFYPAMARPNVKLVTDAITRVVPEGVVTAGGQLHPADVIIYGTGFAATQFLTPMKVTGRDGLDLHDVWKRGAQAYLGMTVSGFPNFFMLYGPNTNLGHNSIVYMLESQIEHISRCMQAMRNQGVKAIEVPRARFDQFNDRITAGLKRTVWAAGCSSWYQTRDGVNPTNWPGFTFSYRWLTRRADLGDYQVLG